MMFAMELLSSFNYLIAIILTTILLVGHLVQKPVACQQHEDDFLQALNNTGGFDGISYQDSYTTDENSKCQTMNIPFCENVDYNKTMMPNKFGHSTQQDVISEINFYHPLLKVNCSPDLRLFLCTAYAPICFDHDNGSKPLQLAPCKSLCESARLGCKAALRQFNLDWPANLNCDKFPEKSAGVICVGKEEEKLPNSNYGNNEYSNGLSDFYSNSRAPARDLGFVCPRNFEVSLYKLNLNGKTYNNCAMPCDDVLFDKNNTQIVRLTTGILAIVCLLSTIFTCVTFLVDTKRFKYPARPIIIIAFCQLVVATCYFIGFLTNNKISCNDPVDPPKSLPNMKMIRTMTMGNKKGSCTLQFMALYFFQMSTVFWWLMLTISWYMIARLKWAPEAVSSVARYFHLFSWTTAALLTIYLSVLGNIEGDSLTGTCYVSVSNQESIRIFIMYPISICLTIGCVFLLAGFKSLWDSRETLRREYGKQTDEHYKLIMRIGLFSALFIIFSLILLFCHYYEQSNLNSWMLSWLSNICKNQYFSIPCPSRGNFSNLAPHYSTFVLKYVATMAIGIISALFMLSEKTLSSYREVAELCNYRI